MEWNLILFIIGFLVVVYLIFKLIKKLVFAIITVFLVIILIFAGVFGLAYMDFKQLSMQHDFNVNLVYVENGQSVLGANIPVKNGTIEKTGVSSMSALELKNLDPEKIKTDENLFVIEVNKAVLDKIMKDNSYEIEGFKNVEGFGSFNVSLNKSEIFQVLDAKDDVSTFLNILFEKNHINGIFKTATEPLARSTLESNLKRANLSLKDALFLSVISKSVESKDNVITLLQAYKSGELKIYPDRFTFKLVRMLPVDMINKYVSQNQLVSGN